MISIIVPVYNVKQYLARCVESIVRQTYKDIEVILVDDGSTDGSSELADNLSAKYPALRVIHKQNGGLSSARNAGLDAMNGDYVMFVDSDDYLKERSFELLLSYAEETKSDIVEFGMIKIFDDNSTIIEDRTLKVLSGKDAIVSLLNREHIIKAAAWDSLYKSEIFKDIRFDVGRLHEDTWFKYKALYTATRVAIIPESIYFYAQGRPGSIMTAPIKEKNVRDLLDAYDFRWHYFEDKGEPELSELAKAEYMSELLSFYYIVNGRLKNKVSIKSFNDEIIDILNKNKDYILNCSFLDERKLKFHLFFYFRYLTTILSNIRYKINY